jgi:hypothetical protein
MSTIVNFAGKRRVEPGAYSQIKSGIPQVATESAFGNVVLIDTGSGAGFGGGSGIAGQLAKNLGSVYGFDNAFDFKSFVKGGLHWDLADYLFNPDNGVPTLSKLWYARACTTTCGTLTYTFTGGAANGGVITVVTKSEGLIANGVSAASKLRKGYGAQMIAGRIDTAKFIIQFLEGTHRGTDPDGDDYGGVAQTSAEPILIAETDEFSNIADAITFLKNDYDFNTRFTLTVGTIAGTGAVTSSDLAANTALKLCTGGTETYNAADLDTVLESIVELDSTFFLADKYGDSAQGTQNTKILAHMVNDAEFMKFMFIGGGIDDTKFTQTNGSIPIAQYYNSAQVVVTHSGVKVPKIVGSGLKTLPALYTAAADLGRIAGLQPQVPGTFKTIRFTNYCHELKRKEREQALQAGVFHHRNVPGLGYVINQSINTIQKNTQMINPDGTSNEISIMRIIAQINKEIALNARTKFIGGNLNTSSPADVKAFVEGYLTLKTASKNNDNLIISFEKVSVKLIQDYYDVKYSFVANSPINKIFSTGFLLDANLSV